MTIDELFTQWQQKYDFSAFIKDGIVDSIHYKKPHILFVLRDMNCKVKNDLCKDLREHGSGWKTWNNVGRWVKALLDGEENYPYDMSNRAELLSRVAVMNLKKEGGGSRTKGTELEQAVIEHKNFIREEIEICDPDIIICCGLTSRNMKANSTLLMEHVFNLPESEWLQFSSERLNREWWYYYAEVNNKTVPVISFAHPQVTNLGGNRGHEKLFKPLYEDMLKIRKMFLEKDDKDG